MLSKRQIIYEHVENFLKASSIIGFYRHEVALRHVILELLQAHARRLLTLVQAIAVPNRLIEILTERVANGLDLVTVDAPDVETGSVPKSPPLLEAPSP